MQLPKNETNYSVVRTNTCILKSEHSLVNKTGFKPPFMIFLYVHNAKDKPSEEKDQLTDAKNDFSTLTHDQRLGLHLSLQLSPVLLHWQHII